MMKEQNKIKAIGLVSGGLDSTLAAKLIKDQGIDVTGVYCSMPWGCGDEASAKKACTTIGIPLKVIKLEMDYLDIIKKPRHGYGAALNPCVDCKIYMLKRAAAYMQKIAADFIFTGEVLGQRPMSQLKHSLALIEKRSGLQGLLLRPLCGQYLPATVPEEKGWIKRDALLNFSGRGRKPQIRLAERYGITEYNQPAGGCLLTEKIFAKRMEDAFQYGFRDFEEAVTLKWGRHYRMNDQYKIILGRDQSENDALIAHVHPDDYIMQLTDNLGPTAIIKGNSKFPIHDWPAADILQTCGGLIQWFSKYKDDAAKEMIVWPASAPDDKQTMMSTKIREEEIEGKKI